MFKTTVFSRCLRAWGPACAVLVCLAAAWFVPGAAAQDAPAAASTSGNYIQLQVDEKLSRSLRMRVSEMLTGGFRDQAQKTQFDDYYKKCVFPEWTVPDNFATKAKGARTPRRRIVSDLKRARQGEVYDRLNRLLLEQMVEFAKGNYHPVTRYNAMLMIGDLNVKQVDLPNPPQPLPEALSILLAAAQNDSLPDGVRMAALLGVIRHDALGANDEASRRKIGDLLLSLAVMRDVPRGRTKDGHGWFRRKAIERLSQRGSAGADGAVAKGIAGVISESDTPLAVRADAAWALGRISLTPQIGLDPVLIAKSLEDLFIATAREEIRRFKQDEAYVID
ncbi:MAG: hypothetical protein JW719_00265, partial [Pirellulales bacterium]|nr:hypothetical protein [Pirellulales bacterium]